MFNTKVLPKIWQLVAVTVMMSLLLAACAAPTPTAAPEPTAAPTAAPTVAPTAEPTAAPAVTTIIQDFENAPKLYDGNGAKASAGDVAYNGAASLKSASDSGEWHTVGLEFASSMDFSAHQALCYYVYDTTGNNNGKANNTVGVKLYDAAGKSVERYTDNEGVGDNLKTKKDNWVLMCMNLVSFTDIDQKQVAKIEFTMYWAGNYYFDDLTLLATGDKLTLKEQPAAPAGEEVAPVLAQGFESEGENFYADYQAEVSRDTTTFHGGAASLKAFGDKGEWHAFGAYPSTRPFDASKFGKLCFWINDTTTNNAGKADNTVGVKLFDASGANQEVWTDNALAGTNGKTVTGEFVQMCMNLDAYSDVDLTKLDKIQLALYWAGTYYVDDIEFSGAAAAAAPQPLTIQDFESKDENFYADYQAEVSRDTTVFRGGEAALKVFGEKGDWHAFGAYPSTRPFDVSTFGKLCFWINDTTTNNAGKADNTVGVKLFDASGANQEVWTDNALAGTNGKTVTGEFVQMCMNLDAYTDIDLTKLDKIQFAMFWAGTYYVDDIELVPAGDVASKPAGEKASEALVAQDFESEGENFYADYQAEVSRDTTTFHGGAASLKAFGDKGDWHAFGAYPSTRPLDVTKYSKMCFWINDTTTNNAGKADNTVGVKLFDASGANQEVWTDNALAGENGKTVTGEFVQMCMNLDAYSDIDLTKLDKIQLAMFWAGTYYVDDIEFQP